MRRRLATACALCTAMILGRVAHADPPADRKASAQVIFDEARDLVVQKKFAEACPKFAESLRLDRGLGTMLWLADCLENNGQTASAWVQFKEAAAAAALANDPREKVARRRVAALEPRLSSLQLVIAREANVPGLEVRRDGIVLGNAELGMSVPVDPGVHTVAASAPEYKAWSTTVELPPHAGSLAVTIPLLERAPLAAATPTPEPVGAAATVAPASSHDGMGPTVPASHAGQTQRLIALVTAGAGVVGIGLGTYFGLHAKSTYDASNADGHCVNNACDDDGRTDRSHAHTQADVSTVAFVLGAAAIAAGGALYFTAPRATSSIAVAPLVAPGLAGISVARGF